MVEKLILVNDFTTSKEEQKILFHQFGENKTKCKHLYPNQTDAFYYIGFGRNRCPICGKIF